MMRSASHAAAAVVVLQILSEAAASVVDASASCAASDWLAVAEPQQPTSSSLLQLSKRGAQRQSQDASARLFSHTTPAPPPPYSNISTTAPQVKPLKKKRSDLTKDENATREDAAKDCVLGEWSDWSDCMSSAEEGMKMWHRSRTRELVQPQGENGTACNSTLEEVGCTQDIDGFLHSDEDEDEDEDEEKVQEHDVLFDEKTQSGDRRRRWGWQNPAVSAIPESL
eukprot:gnl/TRDRNA2_/TRDRNA2_46533_c0_seq1.p1 gnl/TRDRNA2_/TRDRNA2_46533_c0~~gnl/TRDRNA2_/TRDRNA2_46533_c0_seq1.p1  ORF type:complete len:225 (+),score=54.76 gnl/TRDRNA2_/TRDRNA2_46533_c0_seq1:143-817(+)